MQPPRESRDAVYGLPFSEVWCFVFKNRLLVHKWKLGE